MEEAPQNGSLVTQVTTLANTVQELVAVVRDLKQELASQSQELKDARGEKKKKKPKVESQTSSRSLWPFADPDELGDLSSAVLGDLGFFSHMPDTVFGQRRLSNLGQNFYLFNKLPPELRMRIWKLALPSGRLFEPYVDTPHRLAGGGPGGAGGIVTLNFGIGPGAFAQGAGGNANANANAPAPNGGANGPVLPTLRPDPPAIRLGAVYPPPRIRSVCREARRATLEAGEFEFGLFRTTRRGYWFNHSSDIVKLAADVMQSPLLQHIDLSRVQLIAFSHSQFKTEQLCVSLLDLVLNNAPRCRNVIMFYDHDPRNPYRNSSTSKAKYWPLRDEDVVGNHTFPASRGIADGPARWGDLRRVVTDVWKEHMIFRGLEPNAVPQLTGMDLIRPMRLY